MYSLILRSCKLTGAFIIHPCLPFVGVIANSGASSLHGHYPASSLLLAPPPPSRLSADFLVLPVIRLPLLPSISRPGRVGFVQLLSASLIGIERGRASRRWRVSIPALSVCKVGSHFTLTTFPAASGVNRFEASGALTFVAARRLAHHPRDGFVDRLS